ATGVQAQAEQDDDGGQRQRDAEPAPQREVPGFPGRVGGGVPGEQILSQTGQLAGEQAGTGQQQSRDEQAGRFVIQAGGAAIGFAAEGAPQESHSVGEGEHGTGYDDEQYRQLVSSAVVRERLQGGLLAHE